MLTGARDYDLIQALKSFTDSTSFKGNLKCYKHSNPLLPVSIILEVPNPYLFQIKIHNDNNFKYFNKKLVKPDLEPRLDKINGRVWGNEYTNYAQYIKLPYLNEVTGESFDIKTINDLNVLCGDYFRNKEVGNINSINKDNVIGYIGKYKYNRKYFVKKNNDIKIYKRQWALLKYLSIKDGNKEYFLYDDNIKVLAVPDFIGLPIEYERYLTLLTGIPPKTVRVKNVFKNRKPTMFIDLNDIRLEERSIATYSLFNVSDKVKDMLHNKLKISFVITDLSEILNN
jgi:hypothetical protein